jgi:hypothetical protein
VPFSSSGKTFRLLVSSTVGGSIPERRGDHADIVDQIDLLAVAPT